MWRTVFWEQISLFPQILHKSSDLLSNHQTKVGLKWIFRKKSVKLHELVVTGGRAKMRRPSSSWERTQSAFDQITLPVAEKHALGFA